jgi:VanZ family protein
VLPLRYVKRWQIASLFFLAFVLAAALMPVVWFLDDKAGGLSWFGRHDKWVHGFTFLTLSIWFTGLFHKKTYWQIGIGLLFFGLIIEACQRMLIYRTAEWTDVGANTAGIILGLAIGAGGIGGWSLRAEERLTKHNSD